MDCEFHPHSDFLSEDWRMILAKGDDLERTRLIESDAFKRVSFDPYRNEMTAFQIGYEGPRGLVGLVFDVLKIGSEPLGRLLKQYFKEFAGYIITQNGGVEYKQVLKAWGFRLKNMRDTQWRERVLTAGRMDQYPYWNSESQSWETALQPARVGLGHMRWKYAGYDAEQALNEKKILRLSFAYTEELTPEQISYAGRDAADLLPIYDAQEAQFNQEENAKLREVAQVEDELIPVVGDMELRGLTVDQDAWRHLADDAEVEVARLYGELQKICLPASYKSIFGSLVEDIDTSLIKTVDPNSPKDVLRAFHGIGMRKVDKVALDDTSDATLISWRRAYKLRKSRDKCPPIDRLLEYREWSQRKKNFGYAWLDTNVSPITQRIHCSYNQYGAVSGRFSCSGPNMQQIPSRGDQAKKYRKCFRARRGHRLITSDWSQIELRIIAMLSQDPVMLDAFRRDIDLHSLTASKILGVDYDELERRRKDESDPECAKFDAIRAMAKIINFGIAYGMGPNALSIKTAEVDPNGIGMPSYCGMSRQDREAGDRCGGCAACALAVYRDTYQVATMWLKKQAEDGMRYLMAEDMMGGRRYFSRPDPNQIRRKILAESKHLVGRELEDAIRQQIRAEEAGLQNEAKNHPIQGTNGRMLKIAMRKIWEKIRAFVAYIVHVVHDEIVVEAPCSCGAWETGAKCSDDCTVIAVKTIVETEMNIAAQRFLEGIPTPAKGVVADTWSK